MIQEQTSAVLSALRTIANERKGLEALEEAIRTAGEGGLGAAFSEAVKTISAAPGRVIVTGIGKSGLIARKIAATLASTGEPAFFVHPAEASHGDLGMVQIGDVVLAISWSGGTAELAAIVTFAKRCAIPLIAVTAGPRHARPRAAFVCDAGRPGCPTASPPPPQRRCSWCWATRWRCRLLEGRGLRPRLRAASSGGKLGPTGSCGKSCIRATGAAMTQRPDGRGDCRDESRFRLRPFFEQGPGQHHHRRSAAPNQFSPS
jgi:arabinose-5-phosphate isomerase